MPANRLVSPWGSCNPHKKEPNPISTWLLIISTFHIAITITIITVTSTQRIYYLNRLLYRRLLIGCSHFDDLHFTVALFLKTQMISGHKITGYQVEGHKTEIIIQHL